MGHMKKKSIGAESINRCQFSLLNDEKRRKQLQESEIIEAV